MVKYKNFGSSHQQQTIGSFSFSSQNSQHSTKTTRTGKSSRSKSSGKHKSRDERSPSITRREEEDEYEEEYRDEGVSRGGSRFDPRVLPNVSSDEEEIKEGEEESLYDMISYNGVTDEHSTSVCASFSYSAGETDSSAGLSDQAQRQSSPRRAKLSYMGYVPVSPSTGAQRGLAERKEDSQTNRIRNSTNDSNNNNSGHTAGETTTTTGSTFPPIKVDDTSTSRRRRRDYDNDSQSDEEQHQRRYYSNDMQRDKATLQQRGSASVSSGPTVLTDERAMPFTEYITPAQQREIQKQEEEKHQLQHQSNRNRDSTTVASSSVADTSQESSVRPNSLTGHPAMMLMQKRNQYRQQQKQKQKQKQKQSSGKNTEDYTPLSPVVASPVVSSPIPQQQQHQSPLRVDTSANGQAPWVDNSGVLSPLTAAFSAPGMAPPSLNHPPAMMQPQWNPNNAHFQQQYGHQQQQPVQNYPNPHMQNMYAYGPGGNFQQFSPHQQQYPQQQQQQLQQQQPFQSGFFPRNPVLARQLQAFHQYHNQQEKESTASPVSSPQPVTSPPQDDSNSFKPVKEEEEEDIREGSDSRRSKGDSTNVSDSQPYLICGKDGPRVLGNVKFITPKPRRRHANNSPDVSNESLMSEIYGSYRSGGILEEECAQVPGGMKCQSMFANMLNTCGAIVTHGYHTDNTKKSSREKRSKFSEVAEESIAAFAKATDESRGEEEAKDDARYGIGAIGSSSFAANAKKIFHAGNNMMNTLPKDFHNLTQSAAVHNVFDTFQKYNPAASPVQSEEGGGIRAALSDDPDEIEAAKEPKKPVLSPISSQRQAFKELRRRRNKTPTRTPTSPTSPVRRSTSEPNPTSPASPTSPKSVASREKGSEDFKARYSRNIHTKMFSKKMGLTSEGEGPKEPEEHVEGPESDSKPSKDPDGTKDDVESQCSWATPKSQEEEHDQEKAVHDETNASNDRDSPGEKSTGADSLDEVLDERGTEDVVTSTSSGMSDSLVGSDVDDEEPQQLGSLMDSHSEDERQDTAEGEESNDDDEQLVLDSYEHSDFPHTPLHVIEEESEDEDTAVKSVKTEDEIDALSQNNEVEISPSDEMSVGSKEEYVLEGRPMFSIIGVVRFMFVTMLLLQCGTIIALWDQVADQIRAVEGGAEALAAAEDVVSNLKTSGVSLVTAARGNLKASGVSLVTAAQGIVNVDKIDISVEDIYTEIELRTTALMGTANHFMAEISKASFIKALSEEANADKPTQEEDLLQRLIEDAMSSDDAVNNEDIWLDDKDISTTDSVEDIISTTDSVEVQLKEEVVEEGEQI